MLDYAALRALAAVVQTGSFERAARQLSVTPSAISQRVKLLEERLGAALVVRGQPCTATERGERLCRHMERIGMLEHELLADLPDLAAEAAAAPVTLHVATNADSLGSWFLDGIAAYARSSGHLLNVVVDDQDHTAEWLAKGRVVAAVTSLDKPVAGCRRIALGALRYKATASPDFVACHFPNGVDAAALRRAPAILFNQKDMLQARWIEKICGKGLAHPSHWLPSTQSFVDAALSGMGWGMNPVLLVDGHLRAGRLVELVPDSAIDIPLSWQVNRISADALSGLTQAVVAAARARLVAPGTAAA